MQERYTAIPIPCNLFSYAISNEAATPNEPERSLFFSVVIRIAWYRVRRGISPSPAAGYVEERICVCWPSGIWRNKKSFPPCPAHSHDASDRVGMPSGVSCHYSSLLETGL